MMHSNHQNPSFSEALGLVTQALEKLKKNDKINVKRNINIICHDDNN